ncbi:Ilm1p [Saccharomyces paradoxus]|uniref:Ilm1p n=1 Tax=Saccharomyces paradoxus TaxID=27291 RepID=A0A8B8UUI9_SACPA|nr:Ilm1 [Saccharomyces paradoxus]QHS74344.1 Ilm1 [Saccharomyces paradoxus]
MAQALNSTNVAFFRVAFLFTIAFFCLKNVNSILQNTYFLVLTEAMNLPQLTLSRYNGQLGLFALLFALNGIQDLIPLLENNVKYFQSIVPFRLLIFFILTGISYLWESNFYVHNNSVFIYCFAEVWINFLLYNAIREEKNEDFKRLNQFMVSEEDIEEPQPFTVKTETTEVIEIINDEENNDDGEEDNDDKDEKK